MFYSDDFADEAGFTRIAQATMAGKHKSWTNPHGKGARRGGVLISLLVLPLYIPLLIFGVSAVDAAIGELSVRPHLLILAAMLAAALPLSTWAAAAALRQSYE